MSISTVSVDDVLLDAGKQRAKQNERRREQHKYRVRLSKIIAPFQWKPKAKKAKRMPTAVFCEALRCQSEELLADEAAPYDLPVALRCGRLKFQTERMRPLSANMGDVHQQRNIDDVGNERIDSNINDWTRSISRDAEPRMFNESRMISFSLKRLHFQEDMYVGFL